ncbi:MAG: DUF4157 domain-containing protein [Longimicrobiales bacterium]
MRVFARPPRAAQQTTLVWAAPRGRPYSRHASIQAKLTVSAPGDVYEREADRVAEHIMSTAERPLIGAPGIHGENAHPRLMTKGLSGQRCDSAPASQEEREEEDETKVMRKAASGELHGVSGDVARMLSQTRGGGSPLPDTIRTFMETRFGHYFGDVRIHNDSHTAQMTKALHAEAFTTGRDIYFGPGRFAPHVTEGKKLLAHELTHVVQQRSTGANQGGQTHIQPYRLKGFPATEEAAMKAAIPIAADKVRSCSKVNALDRFFLSENIKSMRYDFVSDLGLCGWTFPSAWYVEIGQEAFDKNTCCDLASTIAHEVSHTYWFTEGGARKLECRCFGCSC